MSAEKDRLSPSGDELEAQVAQAIIDVHDEPYDATNPYSVRAAKAAIAIIREPAASEIEASGAVDSLEWRVSATFEEGLKLRCPECGRVLEWDSESEADPAIRELIHLADAHRCSP